MSVTPFHVYLNIKFTRNSVKHRGTDEKGSLNKNDKPKDKSAVALTIQLKIILNPLVNYHFINKSS